MGDSKKIRIDVELTRDRFKYLVAALTEYDEALEDLYEDGSTGLQRLIAYIDFCKTITNGKYEPECCIRAVKRAELKRRGRFKN